MAGRIFYITRTWCKENEVRGAALLRKAYADQLQKFAEVVVVTPAYDSKIPILEKKQICFPYAGKNTTRDIFLQYARLKEDYLDKWVKQSFLYLKDEVTSEDFIYSVTGGELACIKLGAILKKSTGARLVIHFCDPVDGMRLFGEKVYSYHGLNRDKLVNKYVALGDLLLTSSETYQNFLREQYPEKKEWIYNHYMGYLNMVPIKEKKSVKKPMNVVFSGTAGAIQNAEVLYRALKGRTDINVTYICRNAADKKKIMPEKNIICKELMPHGQFLNYMKEEADVGFVGLKGKYLGACVPSRLYEFLNLGLPIIASLPDGSAKEIINKNKYGIACADDDVEELRKAAVCLTDESIYKKYLAAVREDREQWWFQNKAKEFLDIVEIFYRNYN